MKRIFGRALRIGRELFWIAVAVATVVGGYLGYQQLGAMRQVAEPAAAERPIPIVALADLVPHLEPLPIRGEGFVTPFREVALSASIGGRITELNPVIADRGRFTQGDVLVRIDDRSEQAALDQTIANIEATKARLVLTETQLERTQSLADRGIVSQDRLDQLLSQKAELTASLGGLEAARQSAVVALENKVVRAPFDGAVLTKEAELGDVVSPGQAIARLYTADRLQIDVPVQEREAALIPGLFDGARGSATATIEFAGRTLTWPATVLRYNPDIDRSTRTLTVTVELGDEPLSSDGFDFAAGTPPALINAFGKVTIDGLVPQNTYAVPSTALHNGSVWLYAEGILETRPVDVVHVDRTVSYVRLEDLPSDRRLITSTLAAPVEGMDLRAADAPLQSAALSE